MIKRAIWVHGTSVQAEQSASLAGEERYGWGTTFHIKTDVDNWFHVSIPTPVIIDNQRPRLAKLFVLAKTSGGDNTLGGSRIENVHIYDGANRVMALNVQISGDHSTAIDGVNSWTIDPPLTIRSGLGISIMASATRIIGDPILPVTFSTIGADFTE